MREMTKTRQRPEDPEAHLFMFSGGAGSWMTAKRIFPEIEPEKAHLIFADTQIEDEDLYRFLDEAAQNVLGEWVEETETLHGFEKVGSSGGRFVHLVEGRDPWQVFFDESYLGNSRIDPCSKILKREFLREWIEQRFNPFDSIVYLGIDWTEDHRYQKAKPYWSPWYVEAPLCEPPLLDKDDILSQLQEEDIEIPRLYKMGFPHNNCGGFCVKAGISHFVHLLQTMPERYNYHEKREVQFRDEHGEYAILKDRTKRARAEALGVAEDDLEPYYNDKGKKVSGRYVVAETGEEVPRAVPLPLFELRERLEEDPDRYDGLCDWGGCGCFSP